MVVNLVTFETSGKQCEVALLSRLGTQCQVWVRRQAGSGGHAQHALPLLDDLMRQAQVQRTQLSAVAFNQGPGGFTGLRVACGLAQGLAFGLHLPVIPVPSLLAVAERDRRDTTPQAPRVWVILQDARMGEVYAAVYTWEALRWHTLHAPCLLDVHSVHDWLSRTRAQWVDAQGHPLPLHLTGDALTAYPDLTALATFGTMGQVHAPDAEALAYLALQAWDRGETLPPELTTPWYVRDKIAYTTQERAQGLGGNPKVQGQVQTATQAILVPMNTQHLPQVVEIERTVQSFPWSLGNFQDALNSGYSAWVILHDKRVQGFCILTMAPDVAHLLLIAVARDCQRCGLGRWLLHHAQEHVRRQGLPALLLEVRPSNTAARAFYHKLGFVPLSVRKNYYPAGRDQREDALVLRKALQPTAESP